MPAVGTDIAAGTREAVVATWSDAEILDRYPSAPDISKDPAEGFFDSLADAQAAIDARGALLGTERRRFAVAVQELLSIDPAAGFVTARLVDAEQSADGAFLITTFELDLEAETTTLGLFG